MSARAASIRRAAIGNPFLAAASALMMLATAGCERQAEPVDSVSAAATAKAAATAEFADYYVQQKAGTDLAQVPPGTRARLLEDLARLRAAAMLGERHANASTVGDVELARLEILARSAADSAGVYAAPSEAEMQAAYQAYVQSLPPDEFHAQHILVATEPLAASIIAALDGGAVFADIAAARSADDSRTKGGDLGWIRPGHLPAELFQALATLQAGGYTKQPVHTAYGWHVIKLLELRPGIAPPYEEVRAQLAVNLQEARYQRFLNTAQATR